MTETDNDTPVPIDARGEAPAERHCVDCRWNRSAEMNRLLRTCAHPSNGTDVVMGGAMTQYCVNMRAVGGKCGVLGVLWEAAEVAPETETGFDAEMEAEHAAQRARDCALRMRGYAQEAHKRLKYARSASDVLPPDRGSIINAIYDSKYGSPYYFDHQDSREWLSIIARIDSALVNSDDAILLVRHVAGDDCSIEWLWNNCNGHSTWISTIDSEADTVREGVGNGTTLALSLVDALMIWVAADTKPYPRDEKRMPPTQKPPRGSKPKLVKERT